MENMYLEKIALSLAGMKGAWGGIAGGVDRTVGAIGSTISKAVKPMQKVDPAALVRKQVQHTDTAGKLLRTDTGIDKGVFGKLRNELRGHTMLPGASSMGGDLTQVRHTAANHMRTQLNMVKDKAQTVTTKGGDGKILNIKNQYKTTPHPAFDANQANKYTSHLAEQARKADVTDKTIMTARTKVGLGAAGLAGAAAIGYNRGKSSNDVYGGYSQQSPQYY
jgi:hypothetical protein